MRRVLILVEGQTEERFVKDVLRPHLETRRVYPEPKILTTKRVKHGADFKGGVTRFSHVEKDLRRLLADSGAAAVTTMFDLYGLPETFPGQDKAKEKKGTDRARHLERALEAHLGTPPKLRAYLMVHEFEAFLYCDPRVLPSLMGDASKGGTLETDRRAVGTPEDIDDGKDTHPSIRIRALFPAYRKGLHGPLAVGRTGLQPLRDQCPHFSEWLAFLEAV